MVVIAMSEERFDKALLILETLSDLAPTYKPQYAELLRLSGDPEAAANVYTDYLSKAPGDLATMLRLGKLYQGMGVAEAAKTAFSYVLENQPENITAKTLLQQVETAA
jgi:predicted TPR repeat methyltransferase